MIIKQSLLMRTWLRLPLAVRAIVLGFLVSTLGVFIWGLARIILPGLWPIIVMAVILFLFVGFFSGNLVKGFSREFRRFNFRNTRLSRSKLSWGIIAALLMAFIVQASFVFIFRFIEYPETLFEAEYGFIHTIPPVYAWISIIMASLVAGICEEIGYRGYLQTPLEEKYGPVLAIGMTSIIFVFIHLHQAWAAPIIPLIFLVSVFLGYMAYSFQSIIPGIIGHVTFDIFNFSYWWSDLLGEFKLQPISETGVDLHFLGTALVLLIAIVSFIIINRMVKSKDQSSARVNRQELESSSKI